MKITTDVYPFQTKITLIAKVCNDGVDVSDNVRVYQIKIFNKVDVEICGQHCVMIDENRSVALEIGDTISIDGQLCHFIHDNAEYNCPICGVETGKITEPIIAIKANMIDKILKSDADFYNNRIDIYDVVCANIDDLVDMRAELQLSKGTLKNVRKITFVYNDNLFVEDNIESISGQLMFSEFEKTNTYLCNCCRSISTVQQMKLIPIVFVEDIKKRK